MDLNDSTERRITVTTMTIGGLITLLSLIVISVVTYLAFAHGITWFAWHPPFMLLGFLLLMTQAIFSFSNDNILTRKLSREQRLKTHWSLQIGAGVCILIAFICIYTYKSNANREHFATPHGYLGFLTLLFCLGTVGGGIFAAFSINFRHFVKPIVIKVIHSSFGVISYSLAVLTMFYGLNHAWTHERLSAGWINILIGIVGVIWLYIVATPVITVFNRVAGLARSN